MKTKKQTFEVVLETTDEELDGENLIMRALNSEKYAGGKEHIKSIEVNAVRNEWTEEEK